MLLSAPEVQVTAPAIFRASKSSQPGEEVQLYNERTGGQFGALTFANVDDEFYGYFVANYLGKSQIKRIPLGAMTPSGQADVLLDPAPSTIGLGDLVTDGSFLCWADGEGIWSMPIGGGTVPLQIAAGTEWARLSVLGGTLYYTDGNAILSVPTGGGTPSNVLGTRFFPIIALYVLEEQLPVALAEPPGPPAVPDVALVWGRADGAVLGMVRGETTTYQEPTAGTTVSSVYSTGGRILWIEQVSSGKKSSRVLMSFQGVTTTLSSDVGDWDLMADEVAAYWASYSGVEKYTF